MLREFKRFLALLRLPKPHLGRKLFHSFNKIMIAFQNPAQLYPGLAMRLDELGQSIRYNQTHMKKIKDAFLRLGAIVLPEWIAPVFIFLECFYSFGLLLSRLGFFQDDWHHIFQDYWYGTQGLQRFLLTDRGLFS